MILSFKWIRYCLGCGSREAPRTLGKLHFLLVSINEKPLCVSIRPPCLPQTTRIKIVLRNTPFPIIIFVIFTWNHIYGGKCKSRWVKFFSYRDSQSNLSDYSLFSLKQVDGQAGQNGAVGAKDFALVINVSRHDHALIRYRILEVNIAKEITQNRKMGQVCLNFFCVLLRYFVLIIFRLNFSMSWGSCFGNLKVEIGKA